MSKDKSTKDILLEHSVAKVKLFERYLSIYLNILDRAKFVREIILADLFAGEGIYKDGEKGSPIIAFEAISRHLKSEKENKKILFLINDPEKSIIEPEKFKVERVEEWINRGEYPPDLKIKYSKHNFEKLMPAILNDLRQMHSNDRALLFIDPWGYKEIRPNDIKQLISNEKVEILLFLPISFMYRFSKTAIKKGFVGSEPLEAFLIELFGEESEAILNIAGVEEFVTVVREKFKDYLNVPYADDFILTTEEGNTYCLYFFSFNKLGYQKIIEAKWRFDEDYGRGMNREENFNLFSGPNYDNYGENLCKFIFDSEGRTNNELEDFGYEHRFLPKHTKEVLDRLKIEGKIKIESIDGFPVKGFYIGNNKRKVLIKKS